MKEWREVKLGEVGEVIGGGTPSTKILEYWDGNIAWLTPRDLSGYSKMYIERGERNITEEGYKNSSARLMPKGTVLLSSRAPIGYIAIAKNDISTNQGFKSIIVDELKLNNEFLYFWLKANIDYLKQLGTGTTFAEISGAVVKDIDILLPPLPEQKAIAQVLSSLDDKIELLNQQNKTLEQMVETLFRQWFVEEADVDWEDILITDLFEIRDGTHDSPKAVERGKKLITSRHLLPNQIDFENAYYISEVDFENVNNRSEVHQYDILISMIGTIGLLYIELEEKIDYAIKNIGLLKCSQNKEWCYFTFLWLKSSIGQEYIFTHLAGSTQQYITLKSLRNIKFSFPTQRNMRIKTFNKQIEPFFNKIKYNQSQIQILTSLRDTLLPKLMSGDVRVNY